MRSARPTSCPPPAASASSATCPPAGRSTCGAGWRFACCGGSAKAITRKRKTSTRPPLALDWPSWFDVSRTIAVTTVGKNSPLPSLNFVSLRIKDAICDVFRAAIGERPSVNTRKPDIPLTLFLSSDRYTLYLDLSGEPLNRRGYRVQPSGAPLNENLAAGMLLLSGWTPGTPLYDPMMGGGTILLEAAMMSLNIAPGLRRHFAFENLKTFDRIEWLRLHKDAEAAVLEREPLPIFGSDIDPAMVRAAGLNLRAAGLFDCVRLMEADFLNVDPPTETGYHRQQPALRRAHGQRGRPRPVLQGNRRQPETAFPRLDRVPALRRPGTAETHRPANHAPHPALQRPAGMPAGGIPAGGGEQPEGVNAYFSNRRLVSTSAAEKPAMP